MIDPATVIYFNSFEFHSVFTTIKRILEIVGGNGGVFWIESSNLTIINCTFQTNKAFIGGVGYLRKHWKISDSYILIKNSIFVANEGGPTSGVFNLGDYLFLDGEILNNTFLSNLGKRNNLIFSYLLQKNIVGACISTFYLSDGALLTIKDNNFYRNIGDFGCALNFEHRGGFVYVIHNFFIGQSNPTHPVGMGQAMKISGDFRTLVYSSYNTYNDSWSAGNGVIGMFSGYIEEINSTFYNNYAFGGCLFTLFQSAIIIAKNLMIYNSTGSLGDLNI